MRRNRASDIRCLAHCLQGHFPDHVEWDAVIALANESLTITNLASAVRRHAEPEKIDPQVRDYLSEIYARNEQRNARFYDQLGQAAVCLNGVGVAPVLMKGAAVLHARRSETLGARILVDLDLMVQPNEMFKSIDALKGIGYRVKIASAAGSWPGDARLHLPTVLARPGDVGSIDLQCRAKGPALFGDIDWVIGRSTSAEIGGGRVHAPSIEAQIVYLLLHDQFQDGDYWRGLIDLRHLADILYFMTTDDTVDLAEIRALFKRGYLRNAVDTQILTIRTLFKTTADPEISFSLKSRLQLKRRMMQLNHPSLRRTLTIMTLLSEIADYPQWDRFGGEPSLDVRVQAKRLRELRRIFRSKALGKL